MRKLLFKSVRQGAIARECAIRRQGLRSRPRLERLEGRIVMSTFQVNTSRDTVAVDLRTGKDATGHISLRSAIMAADARGGSNTIKLRTGTYTLTIAGANEDASATGDLDILGNLTISRAGAGRTVIDGNNLDRVIQVLRGSVNISGVTIRHGIADTGGGLVNSGGRVTLNSVVVANNRAVGAPGIAGAIGDGSISVGHDGGNGGNGGTALGGGIANVAGSLTLSNSTIASNQARGGAGGAGGGGGFADAGNAIGTSNGHNATGGKGGIGGKGGDVRGGGVFNAAGASISIAATKFSGNVSIGGDGSGGDGGMAGGGFGGFGGDGSAPSAGGNSGFGRGGKGGTAGSGGGLFNDSGGPVLFTVPKNSKSPAASIFTGNLANGGSGGNGGAGGVGFAGHRGQRRRRCKRGRARRLWIRWGRR